MVSHGTGLVLPADCSHLQAISPRWRVPFERLPVEGGGVLMVASTGSVACPGHLRPLNTAH